MWEIAYIGIGSNLGRKTENCLRAVEMMGRIPGCGLMEHSDLYRSSPVGVEGQEWFVNGVASLGSSISAQKLLTELLAVERAMGRIRKGHWEPRIIDLDILMYGREVIHEADLRVPHPLMHLRRFVLVPMAALAPDLVHPGLGLSMGELLKQLPEDDQVVTLIGAE